MLSVATPCLPPSCPIITPAPSCPIVACPLPPPQQSNVSPKDVGTALAVGKAVLGGLCLWRGIEDKLDRD